jgi:hypothetical protein
VLLGGLLRAKNTAAKYFKQNADIDLSGIPNWTPIATYTIGYAFEANYDGNGYVISNLTVSATQPISENNGLGAVQLQLKTAR